MSDKAEAETDVLYDKCVKCGGKGWVKVQTARGERVRACKDCDKGKEAQAAWDAMNAQERADTMLNLLGKYRPKEAEKKERRHGLDKYWPCRVVKGLLVWARDALMRWQGLKKDQANAVVACIIILGVLAAILAGTLS